DIWDHMQYETFHKDGTPSFVVTMDPGSIEVKTPPCLLKDLDEMARPLFIAAEKAGVVAYRNWWYGIKGATEGGCHVNMGGMDDETNPLKLRPDLAVKYCAYVHNRP
ncbi:MAG: transglutaminase family protein, partial [Bacteriovoracaceae bacterium]|nr:transglutaminase family protein [Bacteriovoracaceae bacterium]